MAKRRKWSSLSAGYRARLGKAGIGRTEYESGADLKAARGHKSTPEHPKDAERHPGKFRGYRSRKSKLVDKNIQVITTDGVEKHKLNGDDRETVAKHWNAVKNWARGRRNNLDSFENQTVRDVKSGEDIELETDPDTIYDLVEDEETEIPSIYE